jgi:hypothetical protein
MAVTSIALDERLPMVAPPTGVIGSGASAVRRRDGSCRLEVQNGRGIWESNPPGTRRAPRMRY